MLHLLSVSSCLAMERSARSNDDDSPRPPITIVDKATATYETQHAVSCWYSKDGGSANDCVLVGRPSGLVRQSSIPVSWSDRTGVNRVRHVHGDGVQVVLRMVALGPGNAATHVVRPDDDAASSICMARGKNLCTTCVSIMPPAVRRSFPPLAITTVAVRCEAMLVVYGWIHSRGEFTGPTVVVVV
jgi:hypothetical protein